ncbi:MAG: hypothetical protein QOE74_2595 [Mycobacterium sp.]|jgi:PAS domain S-box-containing protein|nr:hypothetical protein [Mycobacterium sp.]
MAAGSQSFDDELAGLFDHSQDAFCIAGFDGYLKRANPAFPRRLGYTLDELLASPFVNNIHPGDRESVEAVLRQLAAGNPVVGFECRHIRADGAVRWFEWSTSSRPEAGVMYGVARDVTDRRLASDELSALRRVAMVAAEGAAPSDFSPWSPRRWPASWTSPLSPSCATSPTPRQRCAPRSQRSWRCFPRGFDDRRILLCPNPFQAGHVVEHLGLDRGGGHVGRVQRLGDREPATFSRLTTLEASRAASSVSTRARSTSSGSGVGSWR